MQAHVMHSYPWVLTLNDEYQLKDYKTKYVNGEQYYTYQAQDQYHLPLRAIPYEFIIYLTDNKTQQLKRLNLYLNQEEIITAFEHLTQIEQSLVPITLHLNINDHFNNLDIYLLKGSKSIELK